MGKSKKSISKNTYDIRPNSSKSSIKPFLVAFMYVLAKFRWGNRPSKYKISFPYFWQNHVFGAGNLHLLAYVSVCVCKLTGGGGDPPKQGFSQRSVRPNIHLEVIP